MVVSLSRDDGEKQKMAPVLGEERSCDEAQDIDTGEMTELHKGLKARHVSMIAIGGAIGTGLIIGTGSALAASGPLPILLCYTFIGFLVYVVMTALGEMSAWIPLGSGFTGYATRFCDPALGFALGYTYWCKYIILPPNQLTAASLVMQYWVPAEKVNPGVWIAIFGVLIVTINYFGVKFFGEFEFWLSSFKVLTLVALIILSIVLVLGGGPTHDRTGFRYWKNPGCIKPYSGMTGSAGNFVSIWSTITTATFAYLGTELIGVTVGEAQNPRRVIPKAIRLTFWRILLFYGVLVFLLGLLVPYNSEMLLFNKSKGDASASPFVVAIKIAEIPVLPDILNACILLFVLSAANSDLYIASRTMYGLAKEGQSLRVFAKTNKNGTPVYALGISSLFLLLGFLNVKSSGKQVFGYFVQLTTIFGILSWTSILVTHICFLRARKAQNVPNTDLAYTAPFGIGGSYGALAMCCLIALLKPFGVFVHGFHYKDFITSYLGIPLYLGCIGGYKWKHWSETAPKPATADLWTGKEKVDREEQEYMQRDIQKDAAGGWKRKFYSKYVSWLF